MERDSAISHCDMSTVERGGHGGGGVEQREQWEDPLATQFDREIELSQTNRGVGGVCVRVVPRVQSKLSRALHAQRGKNLLQDLPTQKSTAKNRAMVRFKGAREKGAMAFVECLGFSQEDMMEGPMCRETLGRSLGSHDATELVGGMCHGNGCRQETTRPHAISCRSPARNNATLLPPHRCEVFDSSCVMTIWTGYCRR